MDGPVVLHSRSVLCMTQQYKFYYVCMYVCLQSFDAVGWAAGRASGLQVNKLSGGVLEWLSVWSEVQTCIWPS